MAEPDDMQLLREYAANSSEAAFAALVQRHINLVYSVALRHVGDSHQAQDVAQAVFIILSRKAARLGNETVLTGWLYQTARFTAASFLRGERRRQHREQESFMQSTLDQPPPDAAWEQLSPLLDDAMGRLGNLDRNLLLLRFFEGKSSAEAAAALKINEPAAKKRCTRALEKLRRFFSRRGADSTADAIAVNISTHSVQIAPAMLAKTVTALALAKGATASASTLTLIKGALKLMAWTKIKTAAVVGVAAVLTVGTATVVVTKTLLRSQAKAVASVEAADAANIIPAIDKLTPAEIIQKAQTKYASLDSYSDDGATVSTIGGQTLIHTFNIKLARPNLYRIDWRQEMGVYVSTGIVWSAGSNHFVKAPNIDQKFSDQESALSSATGISGGAAATIPGTFYKMNWGNQLGTVASVAKRQADQRIGGVDCYVLSRSASAGRTTTMWIGREDGLIHQVRNDTSAAAMKAALKVAAKVVSVPAAAILPASLDTTSIETHSNIVLNAALTPADFNP